MAYAYILEEIRRKLDDKGERCIFLGYIETSKEYGLYNPITMKFVVRGDMNFQEDKSWNDKLFESYLPIIHADEEEDNIYFIRVISSSSKKEAMLGEN